MMKKITIREADSVEILSLQDNYIEITASDNSDVITRAKAVKDGEIKNSILAEHGFSAVVRVTAGGKTRTLLFDFGFSRNGAARNADTLGVDLKKVEAMVLSHGHSDHLGGLEALVGRIGRKGIPLILHPAAFKPSRYLKFGKTRHYFPAVMRKRFEKLGIRLVETRSPYPLLGGRALFLGEVMRDTPFEKGMPMAHFEDRDGEKWDPIEEDSALVMNLRGKGLVVLSGCAHSGIVNTVRHARRVTGVERVHVVMGGFHLAGPAFDSIIGRTATELKKLAPSYVIPCHCTGRKAVMAIEKKMPEQFILNMAGTGLTFRA
ncbi:MAG TPA: MBL fold metallo-hydrolase [Syntrophales bacterium]|nr:MBL fold metallo-hydrolase [Syntrophales bacterium]HRT62588.1 MBL fold metallo-hydrolase [Syntrophales bacterium]